MNLHKNLPEIPAAPEGYRWRVVDATSDHEGGSGTYFALQRRGTISMAGVAVLEVWDEVESVPLTEGYSSSCLHLYVASQAERMLKNIHKHEEFIDEVHALREAVNRD